MKNVEEEINFLCEIKKLLNQIRIAHNLEHLEIIGIINEIYFLAVDKKLDESFRKQEESKFVVDRDVLSIFENNYDMYEDSELVEEGDEQSGEVNEGEREETTQ